MLLYPQQVRRRRHHHVNEDFWNYRDEGVLPGEGVEERRHGMDDLRQCAADREALKPPAHVTPLKEANSSECGRAPELIGNKNDASLQNGSSEHQQHLLVCQATEECEEVYVLQPRVQGACQPDDLKEACLWLASKGRARDLRVCR